MPAANPSEIANRRAWEILPIPCRRADLGFTQTYNVSDFERIRRGLIPRRMEDKWFIFFEEPWLYLHRSWTGACIYGIHFEQRDAVFTAVESWASRDSQQYGGESIEYDKAVLTFLIEGMLLGRAVPFPVPPNLRPDAPKGLFQHHMVGRAFPEKTFTPTQSHKSVWSLLRNWCRKRGL